VVSGVGALCGSAIYQFVPGMGGVFSAFGQWVVKSFECLLDVAGHGDVHCVLVIVPSQGHAAIVAGCPIH